MPLDGEIGGGGGGGGRNVGVVKEGGGGRPVSMEEGGGGGGGEKAGILGSTSSAGGGGGGGRLSLVGLETVCKVGTDGGGTAMPRLDLQTRQKEKKPSATMSDVPAVRQRNSFRR